MTDTLSAPYTPAHALAPLERWFAAHGWQPFPFQREAWAAYLAGESGLIHSPTGSGKTLAVWGGALAEAVAETAGAENASAETAAAVPAAVHTRKPPRRGDAPPLRVLWITPLRALAADTAAALAEPAAALGLNWTVETRTSDTKASLRARQRDRLPTTLVTTPESLSVLLASDRARTLFTDLRLVVCDEWHELLSTKRGAQAELALARLRAFRPGLRVWGVSATLGNLAAAQRALLGVADPETGEVPRGRVIRGADDKPVRIEAVIPATMERFPWAGHLGLRLLDRVVAHIEAAASTLVFTNTRAQTELWFDALTEARPDWIGQVALHHGSLAPDVRAWVEEALKNGRLRCVVCTSSLDLGVDFAPVEQVIQVGSPKSVGRLMQRAGRSGHRPGAESRVLCVPTHALELIEIAGARRAAARGHIEARPPLHKPLDVLAQHLVTVALGGGFTADALYDEVRTAAAYADLSPEEWAWTLDFVTHGGALSAYAQYHRVQAEDGRYTVSDRRIAQMHRMSIGTIMSDPLLTVQYVRGEKLGSIDEAFASRLKPGDRFTLGGRTLEFVRLREMTVFVRRAASGRGVVPRWTGGSLPISGQLSEAFRAELAKARAGEWDSPELEAVRPILALQAKWSHIPAEDELLVETTETREGHHIFCYPFAGRLAHEPGIAEDGILPLEKLSPSSCRLA
jgi:ATP-dependent Lhr-like helicase